MQHEGSSYQQHLSEAIAISGAPADMISMPSSREVILRHHRFHYLEWGSPEAQPLVFLHGSGLTAHTWDLVCVSLCGDYRCIALDMRGHGDSEWSREMDYSARAHCEDVAALIEHLALADPVVIGHSMGGGVAVRYAEHFSPKALVVMDTGPGSGRVGGQRIMAFMAESGELDSVDEFVDRALAFNPRRNAHLLRRSLLNNLIQLPDGKWTWKYDRRHFGRMPVTAAQAERSQIWSAIGQITCPTLVVHGAESDVFDSARAQDFARALPNGRWVDIPNAGHTVQGDNPRDLVLALRRFFAEALDE
jgi:esterase